MALLGITIGLRLQLSDLHSLTIVQEGPFLSVGLFYWHTGGHLSNRVAEVEITCLDFCRNQGLFGVFIVHELFPVEYSFHITSHHHFLGQSQPLSYHSITSFSLSFLRQQDGH
jgi:hypothetical protein